MEMNNSQWRLVTNLKYDIAYLCNKYIICKFIKSHSQVNLLKDVEDVDSQQPDC